MAICQYGMQIDSSCVASVAGDQRTYRFLRSLFEAALPSLPPHAEEPSTSNASRMASMPPPMQTLAPMSTGREAMQTSYYETSAAPEYQDIWVTIFGFSQGDTPLILKVWKWMNSGQHTSPKIVPVL